MSWELTFLITVCMCGNVGALSMRRSTDDSSSAEENGGNKLLAILVDGFRWDYFQQFAEGELDGFEMLMENGVKTEYLKPVFPTKSTVNHYSLMTGLYAENHGMVENSMYDVREDELFTFNSPNLLHPFWWNDGDPFWITAKRQGRHVSLWFWSGCEVEIRGLRPDHCSSQQQFPRPGFQNFSWALGQAMDALQYSDTDFAGVFLQAVDRAGHRYGPESAQVKDAVLQLDAELKQLQDELEQRDLQDSVNIMLFSDHGMMQINSDACINIQSAVAAIPQQHLLYVSWGPVLAIWTAAGKEDQVYDQIVASVTQVNFKVYKKADILERFHYSNHYRIPPVILLADPGYSFIPPGFQCVQRPGQHGHDNDHPDLWGIFMASGPDFKKGQKRPGLSSVELYQVMCHILDVDPSPNNGTWNHVQDMLVRKKKNHSN